MCFFLPCLSYLKDFSLNTLSHSLSLSHSPFYVFVWSRISVSRFLSSLYFSISLILSPWFWLPSCLSLIHFVSLNVSLFLHSATSLIPLSHFISLSLFLFFVFYFPSLFLYLCLSLWFCFTSCLSLIHWVSQSACLLLSLTLSLSLLLHSTTSLKCVSVSMIIYSLFISFSVFVWSWILVKRFLSSHSLSLSLWYSILLLLFPYPDYIYNFSCLPVSLWLSHSLSHFVSL